MFVFMIPRIQSEIHKYFFAVFFAKILTEGYFFQILSQNRSIPGSHDLMCRFLKFEASGDFEDLQYLSGTLK